MTVKDLITELLEFPMDANVLLSIKQEHETGYGKAEGYSFSIDKLDRFGGFVEIVFTDWRDL